MLKNNQEEKINVEHRYFDLPTQVKFFDPYDVYWRYGIAYKDEIICACCGAIVEINDVYKFKPKGLDNPIVPYGLENWVDVSLEIAGDDYVYEQVAFEEEDEDGNLVCVYRENEDNKE